MNPFNWNNWNSAVMGNDFNRGGGRPQQRPSGYGYGSRGGWSNSGNSNSRNSNYASFQHQPNNRFQRPPYFGGSENHNNRGNNQYGNHDGRSTANFRGPVNPYANPGWVWNQLTPSQLQPPVLPNWAPPPRPVQTGGNMEPLIHPLFQNLFVRAPQPVPPPDINLLFGTPAVEPPMWKPSSPIVSPKRAESPVRPPSHVQSPRTPERRTPSSSLPSRKIMESPVQPPLQDLRSRTPEPLPSSVNHQSITETVVEPSNTVPSSPSGSRKSRPFRPPVYVRGAPARDIRRPHVYDQPSNGNAVTPSNSAPLSSAGSRKSAEPPSRPPSQSLDRRTPEPRPPPANNQSFDNNVPAVEPWAPSPSFQFRRRSVEPPSRPLCNVRGKRGRDPRLQPLFEDSFSNDSGHSGLPTSFQSRRSMEPRNLSPQNAQRQRFLSREPPSVNQYEHKSKSVERYDNNVPAKRGRNENADMDFDSRNSRGERTFQPYGSGARNGWSAANLQMSDRSGVNPPWQANQVSPSSNSRWTPPSRRNVEPTNLPSQIAQRERSREPVYVSPVKQPQDSTRRSEEDIGKVPRKRAFIPYGTIIQDEPDNSECDSEVQPNEVPPTQASRIKKKPNPSSNTRRNEEPTIPAPKAPTPEPPPVFAYSFNDGKVVLPPPSIRRKNNVQPLKPPGSLRGVVSFGLTVMQLYGNSEADPNFLIPDIFDPNQVSRYADEGDAVSAIVTALDKHLNA